ncbi:hypothetical protein DH2020_038543 [Rehmannia glutinosa]|uniref:S-adenosylmethionine-dependent methyltransferase n=1 Tax=Rehmannia glutinosa TaxID=99300 RepID=A0ABR0UY83_REHGL
MAGGDGDQSYTKNSLYQRAIIDAGKSLIQKSISDHLDPKKFPASKTFRIADLGCSVGPNTFISIDNILDVVKFKYLNINANEIPEFQVFFNDHTFNDFNTLFKSLPPNREYYASGVPGSFYTRLFPRASIHIVHSSYSLQWLSQVPIEITDPNSPAWNKGRIHYVGAGEEVINAYLRQHADDFSKFLDARAQEIVPGGLLLLILPARPNELPHSQDPFAKNHARLGACLMDLARKGLIDEEKVDSFNTPCYMASPHEFEQVIKQNGRFSIERMEGLPRAKASHIPNSPEDMTRGIRAVKEELIRQHFGDEILDEVFALYQEKLSMEVDLNPGTELNLFMLLQLKQDN